MNLILTPVLKWEMSLSKQKRILDQAYSDGVASSDEGDGESLLVPAGNVERGGNLCRSEGGGEDERSQEPSSSANVGVVHAVDVVRIPAASEITGQRDVQSVEERLASKCFVK